MAKKDKKSKAAAEAKKAAAAAAAANSRPPPTAGGDRERDNLADQDQNFDSSEFALHREFNNATNENEDEANGSNDKPIRHDELLTAMQSLMGTLTTNSSSLNKLVHVILGGNPEDFDMKEMEKLKSAYEQHDPFADPLKPQPVLHKQSTASSAPVTLDEDDEEEADGQAAFDPQRFISPTTPRKKDVFVRLAITKVGDVNTITMVFGCTMLIQFRWHEPALDRVSDELLETAYNSGKDWWNPDIVFDNVKNEKTTKTIGPKRYPDGKVYLVEKRKTTGDFLQVMKLADFPMDTQLLKMIVSSEKFEEALSFTLDKEEDSGVNVETFAKKQEWMLHKSLTNIRHETNDAFNPDGPKHPAISFMIRVDRKPGFFYWNIFLVMAMISGLSFALFSQSIFVTSRDGVDSRLKLGFTLVLTSVTFRNTVTKNLPPLSYLSGMDKYLFTSMTFLYLMNIYHVVATFAWILYPNFLLAASINLFNDMEIDVLIAFGCVYFVQQLILIFWIRYKLVKREDAHRQDKREEAMAELAKVKESAKAQEAKIRSASSSQETVNVPE